MHKGKLFVTASALLLAAAAPSFGLDLTKCSNAGEDHHDQDFAFNKVSPKWRAATFVDGITGCAQRVLDFAADDTFIAEDNNQLKILPMTGTAAEGPCHDFVGHPAQTGIKGRVQSFCFDSYRVDGTIKVNRYAVMIIWDTPPKPPAQPRPYGGIYSLHGPYSNLPWYGVSVDPSVQYYARIILVPEP
jgi:hypothetical protein